MQVSSPVLVLVIVATVLCSCSSTNVTFYGQGSALTQEHGDALPVELYLDSFGSLYPFGEFSDIPTDERLSQLFLQVVNKYDTTCNDIVDKPHAKLVCLPKLKGYIDGQTSNEAYLEKRQVWESAQYQLWKKYADHIATKINTSQGERDVLFLIHGFNTSIEDARYSFHSLRRRVLDAYQEQYSSGYSGKAYAPIFVQIYWDGFRGKTPESWEKAQSSGSLVGFKLRTLFNLINKNTKHPPRYRVITHSSGAFVIGTALGNPVTAQPLLCCPKTARAAHAYSWIEANKVITRNTPDEQHKLPTAEGIRILMIAAATPGATFTGAPTKGCPSDIDWYGFDQKNALLLVTQNKHDYALTKSICFEGWFSKIFYKFSAGSSAFGSSGLGARSSHLKRLKEHYHNHSSNIRVYSGDFSSINGKKNCQHSVETYLQGKDMKSLIQRLLTRKNQITLQY